MGIQDSAIAGTFTYGYVPKTFPRDPAAVNLYHEHILLGQILEPILDTDQFGNLTPGLATSWRIENEGKKFVLTLRTDKTFSNGTKVTAFDAKYTIDRMIEKNSQSGKFLKSVEKVEAPAPDQLLIFLKQADVSVMKALSRDQMGVVPKGWVFDEKSNEPIIGSGMYRLLRENDEWFLVKNDKYGEPKPELVGRWKLVFDADALGGVPKGKVPDYLPGVALTFQEKIRGLPGADALKKIPQLSFSQTSAWWYPWGDKYKDEKSKDLAMGAIEEAFENASKTLSLRRSTGVIPEGIAGSLPTGIKPKFTENGKQKLKVKVAVLGGMFDEFLKTGALELAAKQRNLDIEVTKVPAAEIGTLKEKKPDIVFGAWAGGFSDPEGFIALLPTWLAMDLPEYIGGPLASIYAQTKSEQVWAKRSEMFSQINKGLRDSKQMVPGWKIDIQILGSPALNVADSKLKYTPRLESVRAK